MLPPLVLRVVEPVLAEAGLPVTILLLILNPMTVRKKSFSGFTLIELLVVMAIVVLISAVGLVSYQDINSNQIISQEVKKTADFIRLTQNYSSSQKKPENQSCETLTGYKFSLATDRSYSVVGECLVGGVGVEREVRSGSLSSITVSKDFSVSFKILTKEVVISPTVTGEKIKFSFSGKDRYLVICKGGDITISETDPTSYCD